jgi:hypothetical protein
MPGPRAPPLGAPQLRSLVKQLECCHFANKNHAKPGCLTLTGWAEPLASLARGSGGDGWRAHRFESDAVEVFGAERVR